MSPLRKACASSSFRILLVITVTLGLLTQLWQYHALSYLPSLSHFTAQTLDVDAACRAHNFTRWPGLGRKVYDLVLMSNELDWLEIRLHTLAAQVDFFVVVESPRTFTGLEKELYLKDNWERYKDFHDKILHYIVPADDLIATDSTWDHEAFLRNSMLESVFPTLIGTEKEAKKGDVILVSDLDEIPRPEIVQMLRDCDFPDRVTLHTLFFYYAYQWKHHRSHWYHPQATRFGDNVNTTIAPEALRSGRPDERFDDPSRRPDSLDLKIVDIWNAGWHCSSCYETIAEVQAKLQSFSHVEWNTPENLNPKNIIERYKHGLDLYGRPEEVFDMAPTDDVPKYVSEQYTASGRFKYLLDRTSEYAEFADAEVMLHKNSQPPE